MRAWMFHRPGTDLELVDIEAPHPDAGQVVVRVVAAGLCHSDAGFVDGEISHLLHTMPIVLGHEVAGVIDEIGPGVSGYEVGDRVVIAGRGLDAPGIRRHGGFGEFCIAPAEQLVIVPAGVAMEMAATSTDAGMTAYHAVMSVGGVQPGSRVGIIGLGGLGLTGARLAVLAGAEVTAAEPNASKWTRAEQMGVSDCRISADELAGLDLDLVVDFAGVNTTQAAIAAVRPGGTVVQVGLGQAEATISTLMLVEKQVRLLGSLGGERHETQAVLDLMSRGDLTINTSTIAFGDIPTGIEQLRAGQVDGRLVAMYDLV